MHVEIEYNRIIENKRKGDAKMKNGYSTYDIVLVDFGEAEFDGEQAGIRPAVIVQNELGNRHSSTTLVAPFTSQHKSLRQPTHSLFRKDRDKGLITDSILLGENLRNVSEKRILQQLGSIKKEEDKMKVNRACDANFPWRCS